MATGYRLLDLQHWNSKECPIVYSHQPIASFSCSLCPSWLKLAPDSQPLNPSVQTPADKLLELCSKLRGLAVLREVPSAYLY